MESFELYSAVRSYYVYRDVWQPSVGEKRVARGEFDNRFDKLNQSIERRRNGRPFTARILENSMVFSRSWWIDFYRSERPSSTL